MGSRSIFDNPSPGSTAGKSLISLRSDPFVVRETPVSSLRPQAVAKPILGQEGGVERVIQREVPPQGISKDEAAAIVAALGPALEATGKAIEDGVTCGKVDSLIYGEVKKIKDSLERFAGSESWALPESERRADLTKDELDKIDAVLACQKTYQEVGSASKTRTTLLVIGGIVIGAIVIAVVT